MLSQSSNTQTNSIMVIIGMINGMIGGVILVLPLLVLESGSAGSGIIITIAGIFSYYSCMLCVKHLGSYEDLDQAILHHFDKNPYVKIFYDFIVFLNLFLLLILYFELIVHQWQGMIGVSIINPVLNFCFLLFLVFVMKYLQFGVALLAYGIISCVGYCIFLIWLEASAPIGQNRMPIFGSGSVTLTASMGQAFSIQTIFIPILRKNKSRSMYQDYVGITFIAGYLIYMYIAYMGSFGILNREPYHNNPETIEEYFSQGYWQLYCLEIIYLIHLYSVFPEFLIISNKRFLSIFGHQASERGISFSEFLYTIMLVGVCLIVSLTQLQIKDIIELNGAVIGFFFIYFLPVATHIKCIYLGVTQKARVQQYYSHRVSQFQISQITDRSTQKIPLLRQQKSIQQNKQQQQYVQIKQTQKNSSNLQSVLPKYYQSRRSQIVSSIESEKTVRLTVIEPHILYCNAVKSQNKWLIGLDIFVLAGMLAVGLFVMVCGIYNVAT